jgi:hypothetical protein
MRCLKALIPQSVAGALANCGGTNFRRERFAGNLANGALSDEEYLYIFHSLIFPNGVRKSTSQGRNTEILARLIDQGELVVPARPRVLDIAASMGIDAKSTLSLLNRKTPVERYVLGDLYTQIFYHPTRGLVFDEDRRLIQVRGRLSFTAIYFAYNYWFQRFTNLPKRVRPWLLRQSYRFPDDDGLVRIPLIHPSIDVESDGSPFRLKRLDVFKPLGERFDLIICMHLLVPRYFDSETLERGVDNLARHLNVGGSLLVGATDGYRLVTRTGEDAFSTRTYP